MNVLVTYWHNSLGFVEGQPICRDLYVKNPDHVIRTFVHCELQTGHGPAPALPPHLYIPLGEMRHCFVSTGTSIYRTYTGAQR